jgi:outer membrane protein assembly factor BamB
MAESRSDNRPAGLTCRIAAPLAAIIAAASAAPVAADPWPGFRGPTGQGTSKEIRLPMKWDAKTGVLWRTPIDGESWSSPIVWTGRVFVTTAREGGRSCHVIALDRRTGAVLWDRQVFTQETLRKEAKNSYATPTPVTDGRRVFASFGDGSFAALDFDGTVAWTNREFPFYGQHGLGTSLVLHRGLLIMARDGSSSGEDKKLGWQTPWDQSFVLALDAQSGAVRWKASRGLSRIAHATPIVVRGAVGDALVSPAGDVVQGFDLTNGKRLWSVASAGEGVVPSPVVAGGSVVTVSGFGAPAVRAVRPGGGAAVAWEQTKGVPMQASPVVAGGYIFTITDGGVVSALDERTGAHMWQERLEGTFSASPVAADGKLYLLNEACETWVLAPGASYTLLSRNPLEGRCQASMAVSGGLLFIRTDTALYAIGEVR